MQFIIDNWGTIATILWLTCELLARLPKVKANSVFLLVQGVLGTLVKK